MTGFALRTNLPEMYIIIHVAAATLSGNRLFEVAGMARVARETIMLGRKLETRFKFVIEADGAPFEIAMATATVCTETTLVNVVPTMAGVAVAIATIVKIRTAVTGIAGKVFVTADQSEAGHCKVVEGGVFPVCRAVAVATLVTVASIVDVVRLMAGDTSTPNVGEVVFLVAGVAGYAYMATGKRKRSECVIEFCIAPAAIGVACAAVVTQLPVVHII